MANRSQQKEKIDRFERAKRHIRSAEGRLNGTLFGPLMENITLTIAEEKIEYPYLACVDAKQGVLWANPYKRPELESAEWTFILAHLLLHLGLNHATRRQDREPLIWNLACDHAADNFLASLKIGHPPQDFPIDTSFMGMPEEEIYELLLADRRLTEKPKTYAGTGLPDLATAPEPRYRRDIRRRTDYENLLAEGIRRATEETIYEVANTLGIEADRKQKTWRPIENARRWVMNEIPLLGALASELRVLADSSLCERMDISIAAVNASLGEIYFHTGCGMSDSEVLFVYVHELLHVALLHHARLQGRDPLIWNYACDFVINGWLVEMGVGTLPTIGVLYDPRLKNMGAEEVYDLLTRDPRRCKGLRGFRGKLGDIILGDRRLMRGDVTTLDDLYRRCMAAGMACSGYGRGLVPAGLLEEIRSLFTPPVPWDVELARWMDAHVPLVRDPLRSYARASRRQGSTPDIPRPARYIPQEWKDACTFGVIMDTSGSMDREMLGRALGAIASYAEAREVPSLRLVLCDAAPYDHGFVLPTELRGVYPVKGRGGTALQPAINYLLHQGDFPSNAPLMIITDGWCESELTVPRDHCFVMPRKQWQEGAMELRTNAPVFRVLKYEWESD